VGFLGFFRVFLGGFFIANPASRPPPLTSMRRRRRNRKREGKRRL
jgi:hypothetical protein